jgi:ABC-type Na+ efflux pump permease subunit
MQDANIKSAPAPSRFRHIAVRVLSVLALGLTIAVITSLLFSLSRHQTGPAGFGRGILHGALMPVALPNLLFGENLDIYAPINNGQPYKLGYTIGVNGCGLIFFSFFFWRLRRLRSAFRREQQ